MRDRGDHTVGAFTPPRNTQIQRISELRFCVSNEDLTAKIGRSRRGHTTGCGFLPFPDFEQSVRDAVEALRRSELIREDITVSGAIYDVHTGERRKVVRS